MASDLQECIAKAICMSDCGETSWSHFVGLRWNALRRQYMSNAAAVMGAIAAPTRVMRIVGGDARVFPSVYMGGPSEQAMRDAERIWRSMLSAEINLVEEGADDEL